MILSENFAENFVKEWLEGWNSHDLDKILSHYSEDFTIETSVALKLIPESGGKIKGKENVRNYWSKALKLNTNLKFEVKDILLGINAITIYYLNVTTNKNVVEILFFNDKMEVKKVVVHRSYK